VEGGEQDERPDHAAEGRDEAHGPILVAGFAPFVSGRYGNG
jgi:hypothetical protein